MNALFFRLLGAAHVVFKVGIPPVNDDVPRLHVLRQLLHRLLGGIACRHHDPCGTRRFQLAHQV